MSAAALPADVARRRTVRSPAETAEARNAWLLTAPSTILLWVMLLLPAVSVVVVAFSDWQFGNDTIAFVGLDNFRDLADDSVFWASLWNTVLYALVVVPVSMLFGLALAILIDARSSLRSVYSVIFFLPFTASLVAMALVWQILLHPALGPVNALLIRLGLRTRDFLHDPALALPTLMGIGIWQLTGYAMLLNLAGLRSIPTDLYEAAGMDGARTAWDRFLLVTWPQLGPTTLFILVVTSMAALQVFETVAVLTKGQPNHATEVLLYTIYQEGFVFLRMNHAAALMCVFLVILGGIIPLKIWLLDRKVHYA